MADMSGFEGGPQEGDVGYIDDSDPFAAGPDVPDAEDQFAQSIADQIRQELARDDPAQLQQAAEEAARGADLSLGAAAVAESHPWVSEETAARYLIVESRSAAAALGDASLGDNPAFWNEVASAMESGARGGQIPRAVAENRAKSAIVDHAANGGLGARCLPW